MQHFYDGVIRKYITQTVRLLSNFTVRYGDGSLVRVPVLYGDADRQAAAVLRQNSENAVNSVPRMSVYVSGLELDRNRLADATFVGKINIREREIVDGQYTSNLGRNYTVERLMPTPFKLSLKVDIWTANTDQKLQILEQILMLFNPSLELQSNDNMIDWSSITVLNLNDIVWSNSSIPVGVDTPNDVATLGFDTPIWISPPVKVKQLGIITRVISNLFEASPDELIDAFSVRTGVNATNLMHTELLSVTGDYTIEVYNNQITLLDKSSHTIPASNKIDIDTRIGPSVNWATLLLQYPNAFTSGVSKIFLNQPNGTSIIGTLVSDPTDDTVMNINWDYDTLNSNTGIDSQGYLDTDVAYKDGPQYRPNSTGTFDAIINPQTYNPKRPLKESDDQPIITGIRYLLIDNIGNINNADGADGWKSLAGDDLIAHENDIVEWTGSQWNVIFDSVNETDTMIWQTNTYTGIQYLWNGAAWVKSFEGVYEQGNWRLEL